MITGGQHPPKEEPLKKKGGMPLSNIEKDDGVVFHHNDIVIVTLNVENNDVHHILIDNRSSIDVIYFDALMKFGISTDRLTQVALPW